MLSDLIWDVDGTIFDTYPAFIRAFEAALQDLDAQAPLDRIAELCRQSLSHCVATLADECRVDADDVLRRFQAHYAATPPRDQPPFPGVIEVCATVRSIGGQNLRFRISSTMRSAQALADSTKSSLRSFHTTTPVTSVALGRLK